MRFITPIFLVSICLATAGQSQAEMKSSQTKTDMNQVISHLKTQCKADIDKLCNDVTPGNGRIAACLQSKEDKLTPDCKTAYSDTKSKISEKLDRAELSFRQNCGSDVQKYCAEVPSGRGRLLDCLSEHESSLSNSCKNFEAAIDKRVQDFFG